MTEERDAGIQLGKLISGCRKYPPSWVNLGVWEWRAISGEALTAALAA